MERKRIGVLNRRSVSWEEDNGRSVSWEEEGVLSWKGRGSVL